jgi:anti-sigma28 factor (negative regulator of flagellin synthesis)
VEPGRWIVDRTREDMKRLRKPGNVSDESPQIVTGDLSRSRVFKYLEEISGVRREKVDELRRRIAFGLWDPESTKVAEKILREHLLDRSRL